MKSYSFIKFAKETYKNGFKDKDGTLLLVSFLSYLWLMLGIATGVTAIVGVVSLGVSAIIFVTIMLLSIYPAIIIGGGITLLLYYVKMLVVQYLEGKKEVV
jgi:hypothetical protein